MSEVLLRSIQFTSNNPFGGFVAGDTVNIYIETDDIDATAITFFTYTTVGIYMKKNGVLDTTSSLIDLGDTAYKTDTRYLPQICTGTSKLEWVGFVAYPYEAYYCLENHYSCVINPPTCNLIITGTPTVVGASSSTATDGSITITATSANAIEYKLGSDFTYGDGTGQSTGIFTALAAGQYRIYVRDSVNCFASVLVTINIDNSYGPIYRLEYDDPVGGVTRLDIVKRSYSSGVTEVLGTPSPWIRGLRGEGSQDKFETILATKATLGLTSESNFYYESLYTNNPEEFRINFYKNSVLQGVYKVLPNQYGEDYKAPPYYTYITAICGLASLKDYVFLQDDGQRFNGSMSCIKLIAFILKKTKLYLHINVAINLYSTGMNTAASDDPLDQSYVDTDTYYINAQEPTLDYVLDAILAPYGARIVQENGVWNIVRVEEMRAEYDYREFDENGDYVANDSYDPIVNIVSPESNNGFNFSDTDHYMSLMPGYGKIRLFYKLGLRSNILENGDFRLTSVYFPVQNAYAFDLDTFGFQLINSDYTLNSTWEAVGSDGNVAWKIYGDSNVTAGYGDAYIQSDTYNLKMGVGNTVKLSFKYKIPAPFAYGLTPIPIDLPYQKVRIRVKYGTYYLLSDGTWSTDENFITVFVTEFEKFLETELIATQPDSLASNGYDFEVRLYHSYIFHAEFTTFDDLRAKVTYDSPDPVLPEGTRSQVAALGALQSMYFFELEENTDAEDEPNIIRPDDYHAVNNPVQWILKKRIVKTYFTNFTSPFWIDSIKARFLANGADVQDTILRDISAEVNNAGILEKEVIHGSYQSTVVTIPQWDYGVGKLIATSSASLSLITTNVLSADILYAGYFRAEDGAGWETWTRDGISEETSLHAILLQQHATQYRKAYRRLTGSFYSDDTYYTFLNVLKEQFDSDRLYLPMSPEIDDYNNRVRGEFLELIDVTEGAGSNGSGSSPFSSAFTIGFGSGYN